MTKTLFCHQRAGLVDLFRQTTAQKSKASSPIEASSHELGALGMVSGEELSFCQPISSLGSRNYGVCLRRPKVLWTSELALKNQAPKVCQLGRPPNGDQLIADAADLVLCLSHQFLSSAY